MERKTYNIDASGRILGRMAVEIAVLLRGKNKPDFELNRDMGDFVVVKNFDKIKLTGNKVDQKIYYHHSGYLGGMSEIPFKRLFEKEPIKVLRKAVRGMLPNNKLRSRQIKRLRMEK